MQTEVPSSSARGKRRARALVPAGTALHGRFLARRHVARIFGVSVSTVTRWAQLGLLPSVRTPGGHYRFPESSIARTAGD